jgi:tetratricopeptide (TPR) repeat protein
MIGLRRRPWLGCCTLLLSMASWFASAAQDTPQPARPPSAPGPETPISTAPQPGRARPQAQTAEEAAAYQAFLDEQDPDRRIRLVEDFLLAYPETQLKEYAYQVAMQAYQGKNDLEHLLTYGELVLGENPDNVTALLTLATAISELTSRTDTEGEQRLADGDQYAREALDVLARLRRPPGFPEEQWNDARRESESVAHGARGLIALIREDFVRAELELKEAVALARNPYPALLYRLGMSYSFQKKYAEALEVLDRAAALGGIKVATSTGSTRDIVAEAREFASKALAATAPSPMPSVAPVGAPPSLAP